MVLVIGMGWPMKFTRGKAQGDGDRMVRAKDRALHTRGAGTQAPRTTAVSVHSTKPAMGMAAAQQALYKPCV